LRLLAVETATRLVGCALWADDGPVACFSLVSAQRHAEALMPAIDGLFRQAEWRPGDLDAVVADVGPGLFTGLRVGLATARALTHARGVPAVGVTSLEVLAHPHRWRPGLVAPVVDARRGEVYWAVYESDGTSFSEARAPEVATPGKVAASLAGLPQALVLGDGAVRYQGQLFEAGALLAGPGDMWPSPLVLAELGARQIAAGNWRGLEPLYLRSADVRIGWEEVGGRAGTGERTGAG
jgi:tRNA threonylcarbamoyladenosine biosynthesis protein TsaB